MLIAVIFVMPSNAKLSIVMLNAVMLSVVVLSVVMLRVVMKNVYMLVSCSAQQFKMSCIQPPALLPGLYLSFWVPISREPLLKGKGSIQLTSLC